MKTTCVRLLAAVATLSATAASASGSYSIAGLAQTNMTYQTKAAAERALSSGYSGVGSLFVSYASTATTGLGGVCTGSLLSSTTVLTAAHCLSNFTEQGAYDPVTAIDFILPSFGDAIAGSPTTEIYGASNFAINPLYDKVVTGANGAPVHVGDIGGGHDEALFTLDAAAVGHDTYGLYTGDPLKRYTEVGTGTIGGPKGQSVNIEDDYLKRVGHNIFEATGDQLFSDVSSGVVFSDFDDGTDAHDVLGAVLGIHQTGIKGEADSSQGDSGGPEFIDGLIAATTSFGITGGVFNELVPGDPATAYCGADSLDPYNVDGKRKLTLADSGGCTNSSVGELAGDTLVSSNLGFIEDYLDGKFAPGAVPEPASWTMLLVGFGAIGSTMRRRSAAMRISQAV